MDELVEEVCPEWFLYQQEVYTFIWQFTACMYVHYTTPAPPTPTNVTIRLKNTSSVRIAWQWTSSDPVPNCFNTTAVTYHPEGGSDSSLQLSNPEATEATLTDLQCNASYTITVVATAGEHRSVGVMENVTFLPLQGM